MTFDVNVVAVVLVDFAFIIGIGLVFRRTASNSASDYFRSGGKMSWGMVGASSFSFTTRFSARAFTDAAGKAHGDWLTAIAVSTGNVATCLRRGYGLLRACGRSVSILRLKACVSASVPATRSSSPGPSFPC
ncbi:MAG TPA: hypothetical protein VLC92_15320 [Rhodocyclaceae bacterium]|nr:hypothetical protein [Rhodocyclaceae bacterium]